MATKAEIIAQYGQAYYDAFQARNREKAHAKYHATPLALRVKKTPSTEESRKKKAEYANKWYHQNAAKVITRQTEALQQKMDAMSAEELAAFNEQRAIRVKRSRGKKLEQYREKARNQANAKYATLTAEERNAISSATWKRKRDKLRNDEAAYEAHRATMQARHSAWREANRDKVNAYSKEQRKKNPEFYRTYAIKNQQERRAVGKIQREFIEWIRKQPCVDCGATERIEVGHIISIKNGGTNDATNLIPQCRSCNARLSAKNHKLATPKEH